jgi:putative ABC transport system permease protein
MPAYVVVAWCNLLHNRRRGVVSTLGVGFTILLLFMQLGFLNSAKKGATLVYEDLAFDAVLVSDRYQSIAAPGYVNPVRLAQARAVVGVDAVAPFHIVNSGWENQVNGQRLEIMVLGVPGEARWLRNAGWLAGRERLERTDAVLIDAYSSRDYGDITLGATAEINGRRLEIVGGFNQGMSMFSEGAAALNVQSLDRVMPGQSRRPSLGLLQFTAGADVGLNMAALREAIPGDTRVLTRAELMQGDQDYFVSVKPVGVVFKIGALVALLAGAVLLYQVVSAEISHRTHEYATMRAMGMGNGFVYRVCVTQSLFYGAAGFVPAWLAARVVFTTVRELSRLPMELSWQLSLQVAALVVLLCLASCLLASSRLRRADPTELFG